MKLGYCAMHDLIWFAKKVGGETTQARVRTNFRYQLINQLYCRDKTRSMTPSWLKVLKLVRLLQAASWVWSILHNWHWLKIKSWGVNWMFLINIYQNWIKTIFELVGLLGNIFLPNMPDYGDIRQFFHGFPSFPPFTAHFCAKRQDF